MQKDKILAHPVDSAALLQTKDNHSARTVRVAFSHLRLLQRTANLVPSDGSVMMRSTRGHRARCAPVECSPVSQRVPTARHVLPEAVCSRRRHCNRRLHPRVPNAAKDASLMNQSSREQRANSAPSDTLQKLRDNPPALSVPRARSHPPAASQNAPSVLLDRSTMCLDIQAQHASFAPRDSTAASMASHHAKYAAQECTLTEGLKECNFCPRGYYRVVTDTDSNDAPGQGQGNNTRLHKLCKRKVWR